jgi:hypothetical protein
MDQLEKFIADVTARPVPDGVRAFAHMLATEVKGAVAVIAYGSALRDSVPADTLIDYYVLVERPRDLSERFLLRLLGALVPPNVYYAEKDVGGTGLRCKYAVMTLAVFVEKVSTRSANPYFWARFSQPSRVLWTRSDAVKSHVIEALACAARTAFAHGLFLSTATPWQSLFENTYRTELRPESGARAALIVEADKDYYAQLAQILKESQPLFSSWAAKRFAGKLWSTARLAKAAFTFQGGAEYAAWKIRRHSGVTIEVTDWQRKHPFLAGLMILPKVLRKKGLK